MRYLRCLLIVLCLSLAHTACAQSFGSAPTDDFTVMKDDEAGKPAAKGKTRILAWGSNAFGQLGNGAAGPVTNIPVIATKVEEILQPDFKVLQLASSENAFCLLRSDKTVWCWGGQFFGPEERKFGPVKIEGLPPVKELTGGSGTYICATTDKDQAWCWFNNEAPQRFRALWATGPELMALSDSFSKVFVSGMGEGGCGVTVTGDGWCWGGRQGGSYPLKLKAPQPIRKANSNGWARGCALLQDGAAWCWDDPSTQWGDDLGKGTKYKELQRQHLATGLRDDGTIWRSDGTNFVHAIYTAPGKMLGDVRKISVGTGNNYIEGSFTCAIEKAGRVWCWNGAGFGGIHYPAEGDYASLVRGPDSSYPLDHVTDLAVAGESAIAVVEEKDYKLVPETDAARIFYTLVYSGRFREAKEHYSRLSKALAKDDPLAQEALQAAITADQTDLVKAIAAAGVNLELPNLSETALWQAVKTVNYGRAEKENLMLKVLLAHGAKPDTSGLRGLTPVKYLEQWGDSYSKATNLLKAYIKNGNQLTEADAKEVQGVKMGTSQSQDSNRRPLSVWIKPAPRQPAPAYRPPQEEVATEKPAAPRAVAYVRKCAADTAAPNMLDYSVIFTGRAGAAGAGGMTPFTVTKTYKGDLGDAISIAGEGSFAEGAEMLVFAHRRKDSEDFALFCTPIYSLSGKNGALDPALALALIDLELFNAKVKATGVFEKEYHADISHYVLHPDDVKEAEWRKAAELLDEGNDFERSAKTYAAIMAKMTALRGSVNKRAARDRYNPDRCDGLYAENSSTPPYVQATGSENGPMLGYGRALFMMGRDKEALRPLCLDNPGTYYQPGHKNAAYYRLQALLRLGEKDEVDTKHLDFSGARLTGVDLSNLNIERSNFTHAAFSKIDFRGARLGGTDFENAQIRGSDFTKADLRGANFKGALVDATLTGTVLENALYDSKTIWPKGFDPAAAGAKAVEGPLPPQDKFNALPSDFDIAAVGVYSGTYPDGVRSAHDYYPTSRVDIEVKKTDKPVIIAIGSHDTADWHFHLAKGARVAGVIVGGLYQQSVFGLPGDVQVIRSGNFYGPFGQDGHGETLKKILMTLTGKDSVVTYETAEEGVFQIR